MPKDPKRNIQRYKVQGGHLNEFEYQKNQTELAAESEFPFATEPVMPNPTQAQGVAGAAAQPQRAPEKPKAPATKSKGRVSMGATKKTARKAAKKTTKKSAKKSTTKGTKKRASLKRRSRKSTAR